jgi:tellurite resistance-related uncharacterized protein
MLVRILKLFIYLTTLNLCSLELPPIFVSLGSDCSVASMLRSCNLKNLAYPFDWITSHDSEGLIKLLDEDFRCLLDDEYLAPIIHPNAPAESILMNTRYNLWFVHDGNIQKSSDIIRALKEKYNTRLNRFRDLSQFQGKVYFVREARQFTLGDQSIFVSFDNHEISSEYALQLREALQRFFPYLHMHLIIINHSSEPGFFNEENLFEGVSMLRLDPKESILKLHRKYHLFFNRLISES